MKQKHILPTPVFTGVFLYKKNDPMDRFHFTYSYKGNVKVVIATSFS